MNEFWFIKAIFPSPTVSTPENPDDTNPWNNPILASILAYVIVVGGIAGGIYLFIKLLTFTQNFKGF